jgi:shikimate kinase
MNADLLKRVIRAIAEESQDDLGDLAHKIVDRERTSGHTKLADQLDSILKQTKSRKRPTFSGTTNRTLRELPTSRRNGELLTTFYSHDVLEHDMVLPAEVEAKFVRIECEFAARERLGAYGLKPRKTILLHGPSGCGKSLGAKRLAWNTGLPLMKVRFDALLSSFFGESAANLRTVFDAAKERPCLLVLDECDFIARSRIHTNDIGEAARIVNVLLLLMEEYDAPGLLVATTNIESALDDALFRRFDDSFLIPPPGKDEIEVTLSYSAIPRRTRRNPHHYLSNWVSWTSSKLGEDVNCFLDRALKDQDNSGNDSGSVLQWKFHENPQWGTLKGYKRNQGTVVKDWAVVQSHKLPEEFCIAVVGHKGWSQDPNTTANYTLTVSFEILGKEIPIYEILKIANQIEIQTDHIET